MTQLVIAARGGRRSKSRCARALDGAARSGLTGVMLEDMLAAATRARCVSAVMVVTPTRALAAIAQAAGASVLRQRRGGLNAAFVAALADLAARTSHGVAVLLPGDLPLLRPDDLDDAIELLRTHEIVLAPTRDGGTGAVVTRADAGFSPAFGRRSFARHADAARARGLTVAIFDGSSLGEDVDRPEDLCAVLAHGSTTRTAAFLRDRLPASGVFSEGRLTRPRADPGWC